MQARCDRSLRLVPPILGRKQMIYLAKSATAHGVVNLDPGLPPWRPITVQSAFSSRLFTVIRDYISPCIPNEEMQHGFQRDRTVQDAVVLTSLLLERAERRQEELFLISKDCLKCFDRIPGWVMEYIYPFGWLDGGIREFGLGQGSILAVMHIGYYMDVLIRQQQGGTDSVYITHSQHPHGTQTRTISSLLFVDDALDVSTTYAGIQDRATVSNQFTGQTASGGVFGADKSFLIYLSPQAHPAIALNDGLGKPQPIQADAIAPRGLGKKELQYIINAVWIPSALYRTAISDAISIGPALDTLFRKTARRVLRLPHDHPNAWFYDPKDGLGLVHCERFSHSQRLYQFLRIANDRGSPAHDILMESLEAYQLASSLTDHPLAFRIPPPTSDTTFLGTLHQPRASRPHRPNDRPIWAHLTPALGTTLISLNRSHNIKVRWFGWSRATLQRFAPIWDAIPIATPTDPTITLPQLTLPWAQPLGRTFFTPSRGFDAIHIPLHAMLVVPHHLNHQDGRPATLSYRIGRRTSLQTATLLPAPKLPSPSGMKSVGVPTSAGDLIRTSRAQRHKFIPWNDTT
ncbi:hypothetical protein H257_18668 [Aphanomyces astaci]|uniref:Uncharacterized protein n=1 Tax=Aphanomyces astaci TaxID=112090 RepID=W4FC93_APHAT|nr:hypothetical protein H257_18668 [Aphanomyces astaci]ETV64451.1 hypothetical protein H257_18668 [Aphanomyces astaci]|eukprot:XP_009846064.1 hypothetical protein H257_18668 [Aphanomyces astaci]